MVCLSNGALSNNFVKVLVLVHVPGMPEKTLGAALLAPKNFLLNCWYFFGSLVNDTFSNLKFNIFIITGSIFGNKYMKQVVLINHSWISITFYKRNGDWSSVYSSKNWVRYIFFCKKGRSWWNSSGVKVAEGE